MAPENGFALWAFGSLCAEVREPGAPDGDALPPHPFTGRTIALGRHRPSFELIQCQSAPFHRVACYLGGWQSPGKRVASRDE